VAVDDGDSEEGGDGSNVDVNENDGGEITEDEAINDGESNIAAVEGNEGGEDVDGGNDVVVTDDEDGSIDLVDDNDGEKDEASVAMTINDENTEDGESIATAVEDNDGETYDNGDNLSVDGEGEETVGKSISMTIDDENGEDGESNNKSTIDDASENSDPTSLPIVGPAEKLCERLSITACDDQSRCPRDVSDRSGIYQLYEGECGPRAMERYPVYCKPDRGACCSSMANYLYATKIDSEAGWCTTTTWYLQDGALCGHESQSTFQTWVSILRSDEGGIESADDGISCACTDEGRGTARSRTRLPFDVECLDSTSSDRAQFYKGQWKAYLAFDIFVTYFANI